MRYVVQISLLVQFNQYSAVQGDDLRVVAIFPDNLLDAVFGFLVLMA